MIVATLILLCLTAGAALVVAVRRPRHDLVAAGVLVVLVAACAAVALPAVGHSLSLPARVVIYLTVAIIAVAGGGPLVRTVLAAGWVDGRRANPDTESPNIESPNTESPAPASPAPDHDADHDVNGGPLRGGRIIGYLERAAVCATLLAGWPESMAVILAVKSLARYPELRAPHASEQFIMGTFTSVLWACGLSGVGFLALH